MADLLAAALLTVAGTPLLWLISMMARDTWRASPLVATVLALIGTIVLIAFLQGIFSRR